MKLPNFKPITRFGLSQGSERKAGIAAAKLPKMRMPSGLQRETMSAPKIAAMKVARKDRTDTFLGSAAHGAAVTGTAAFVPGAYRLKRMGFPLKDSLVVAAKASLPFVVAGGVVGGTYGLARKGYRALREKDTEKAAAERKSYAGEGAAAGAGAFAGHQLFRQRSSAVGKRLLRERGAMRQARRITGDRKAVSQAYRTALRGAKRVAPVAAGGLGAIIGGLGGFLVEKKASERSAKVAKTEKKDKKKLKRLGYAAPLVTTLLAPPIGIPWLTHRMGYNDALMDSGVKLGAMSKEAAAEIMGTREQAGGDLEGGAPLGHSLRAMARSDVATDAAEVAQDQDEFVQLHGSASGWESGRP